MGDPSLAEAIAALKEDVDDMILACRELRGRNRTKDQEIDELRAQLQKSEAKVHVLELELEETNRRIHTEWLRGAP